MSGFRISIFFNFYSKIYLLIFLVMARSTCGILYGHKEVNIKEQFAYFLSDVGYAEVFIRFGFIGLFYILMFLRAS